MGKFRTLGSVKVVKQKFDQKRTFKKYGKDICIHDFIQEDKEAVDIYGNLELYGSVKEREVNISDVVQDLTGANDLRSWQERKQAIEEIWKSLPLKEREKFNNNFGNFVDNGYEYFLDLQRKAIEKQKQQQQQKPKEDNNNGSEE